MRTGRWVCTLPALLTLAALSTGPAAPARAAEAIDLTGSLRADAWSGTRQLDDAGGVARASLWGRARADLGAAGRLVADGWLAAQSRRDHGVGRDRGTDAARLRELTWQHTFGPVDLKLGRQIVAWGRADGWNPTDHLAPRDYTLLVPVDGEQRRGNDGVQARVDTGIGTVTGLWFARGGAHTVPLETLPQVTYRVPGSPRRAQWALKLDMAGEGVDGSVSFFHGDDPLPDLVLEGVTPQGLQVGALHQPLRVLGADLSLTRGEVVWRAEAAWSDTASSGAGDPTHKRPRLWLVAGAEWPLADHITLGLQATLQRVQGWRSPDDIVDPTARAVAWRQATLANQTSATQAGVVWRLAGRWLNDNLLGEVNGVWLDHGGGLLWRTRLSWAVDDRVQLLAGTDHLSGPAHGLWGALRRNRVAYAQVRAGF